MSTPEENIERYQQRCMAAHSPYVKLVRAKRAKHMSSLGRAYAVAERRHSRSDSVVWYVRAVRIQLCWNRRAQIRANREKRIGL